MTAIGHERILPPPRFHRITEIQLFHLVRLDDDHAEIRPGDRVMQVRHTLSKLMVLVRLHFRR